MGARLSPESLQAGAVKGLSTIEMIITLIGDVITTLIGD